MSPAEAEIWIEEALKQFEKSILMDIILMRTMPSPYISIKKKGST